jgi:hypothetical protein
MAKRKKSESVEHTGHRCYWAGCVEPGDFRAPRARDSLREFQWFCEEHIKEFNKKWNYFEGMSETEIYAFQKDATTGHRPTWRMDQLGNRADAKLEEAFSRMFGDAHGTHYRADARPIAARDKDALATLDLEHPSDKAKIKAQYRALVKKYHPDVNRGHAQSEEIFKKVTRAYHHLMAHYVEQKS